MNRARNSEYQAFVQVVYPEQELGTYHKAYTYGIPFGCIVPKNGDLVSVDAAGRRTVAQVVRAGVPKPSFQCKPATQVTPYSPGGYVSSWPTYEIRSMTATEVALIQQREDDAVRKVVESPLFQRELERCVQDAVASRITQGTRALVNAVVEKAVQKEMDRTLGEVRIALVRD